MLSYFILTLLGFTYLPLSLVLKYKNNNRTACCLLPVVGWMYQKIKVYPPRIINRSNYEPSTLPEVGYTVNPMLDCLPAKLDSNPFIEHGYVATQTKLENMLQTHVNRHKKSRMLLENRRRGRKLNKNESESPIQNRLSKSDKWKQIVNAPTPDIISDEYLQILFGENDSENENNNNNNNNNKKPHYETTTNTHYDIYNMSDNDGDFDENDNEGYDSEEYYNNDNNNNNNNNNNNLNNLNNNYNYNDNYNYNNNNYDPSTYDNNNNENNKGEYEYGYQDKDNYNENSQDLMYSERLQQSSGN